jgi:D-alanyl-D-alanine carboxypeptidase (penicillin-binding protein 5/6)
MKAFLKRHWLIETIAGLLILAVLISYGQLKRPVPEVSTQVQQPPAPETAPAPDAAQMPVPYPAGGSTAVAVRGVGFVGASPIDKPRPIASLVKVMTAYVVLKDHPLTFGEHGPKIDITAADVDAYRSQRSQGESVVEVKAGTQVDELNLLEGLLVPSGNNLALVLANWNSGSVDAFVARMNEEAKNLGMKDTRYAEPSGASPSSHSTAKDQLILAEAAMSNPAFAAIVGEKQATLPTAGILYNVNTQLGKNGVAGVKTGWTDEAGACFIMAMDSAVGGQPVQVLAVTLGQDTLADAFAVTTRVAQTVAQSLQVITPVTKADASAMVKSDWGDKVEAAPKDDLSLIVWPGMQVDTKFAPADLSDKVKKGQEIGKMIVTAGNQVKETPVVSRGSIGSAGLKWRLSRLL